MHGRFSIKTSQKSTIIRVSPRSLTFLKTKLSFQDCNIQHIEFQGTNFNKGMLKAILSNVTLSSSNLTLTFDNQCTFDEEALELIQNEDMFNPEKKYVWTADSRPREEIIKIFTPNKDLSSQDAENVLKYFFRITKKIPLDYLFAERAALQLANHASSHKIKELIYTIFFRPYESSDALVEVKLNKIFSILFQKQHHHEREFFIELFRFTFINHKSSLYPNSPIKNYLSNPEHENALKTKFKVLLELHRNPDKNISPTLSNEYFNEKFSFFSRNSLLEAFYENYTPVIQLK